MQGVLIMLTIFDQDRLSKRLDGEIADVAHALTEYQKFLLLCKEFPKQKIIPPSVIEKIWHMHILDTVNYSADCQKYFGYFLHHDPCLNGVNPEELNTTIDSYRALFGNLDDLWIIASDLTCANPGGGCGSISVQLN